MSRYWNYAAAVGVAVAGTANADIIVTAGALTTGTDSVLLTDATDVAVATGTVGAALYPVSFQSSGGNLTASTAGQALVTASTGNDPFTNISFSVDNATFTKSVFDLRVADDGQVLLQVSGINITGGTFALDLAVSGSGTNFFTIDAINGQLITQINLTAQLTEELEELRLVRIGGVTPIPEPTSALLVLGLCAAYISGRRMRRLPGE